MFFLYFMLVFVVFGRCSQLAVISGYQTNNLEIWDVLLLFILSLTNVMSLSFSWASQCA